MRLFGTVCVALALLGPVMAKPAAAQSLNDLGNQLKDRLLNQGKPDQDSQRRAYEQGRQDEMRTQQDERRRGDADRQRGQYDRGGDREQGAYGDRGQYDRGNPRRSDDASRHDTYGGRQDENRRPDPGRY